MNRLPLLFALFLPAFSRAQSTSFVLESGFLRSTASAADTRANYLFSIGPYGSVALLLNTKTNWSFQAGLRINPNEIAIKQDSDLSTGSLTTATPLFLRLPVYALYQVGTKKGLSFQVLAGGYAGIGLGGKYRRYTRYLPHDEETLDLEERPFNWTRPNGRNQRLDYGFEVGARLGFMQDRALLNVLYSRSLAPLAIEGVRTNPTMQSVLVGIGYIIILPGKQTRLAKPDKI